MVLMDEKELNNEYINYLKNLINYILPFTNNNPLKICATYSYMLKKGYLSYFSKFYFTDPTYELEDYLGFSLITGEGLCRNINKCLCDILNILKKESIPILLYVKNTEFNPLTTEKYQIKKDLKNHYQKKLLLLAFQKLFKINHMISSVIYHNNVLFLDASNDTIFYYSLNEHISTIGLNSKPIKISYSEGYIPYKKFNLNKDKIINTYQNQERLCLKNNDYLEKFKHDNQDFQEYFYNELKLYLINKRK